MACVDIDVDDYLYDASVSALKAEVARRVADGTWSIPWKPEDPEPWSRAGLAADIRAAYYARDASRLELLLVILEDREADGSRIRRAA